MEPTPSPTRQMVAWRSLAQHAYRASLSSAGLSLYRTCREEGVVVMIFYIGVGTALEERLRADPSDLPVPTLFDAAGEEIIQRGARDIPELVSAGVTCSHLVAHILGDEGWVEHGDELFYGHYDGRTGELEVAVNPDADAEHFAELIADTSIPEHYLRQIQNSGKPGTPPLRLV